MGARDAEQRRRAPAPSWTTGPSGGTLEGKRHGGGRMTVQAMVPRMTESCGPGGVVTDPAELRPTNATGSRIAPRPAWSCCRRPRSRSPPWSRSAPGPGCRSWPGVGHRPIGGRRAATDGVLIVMSRMRRIIAIDPVSQRAIVEPGVTNLAVSPGGPAVRLLLRPGPVSQEICSVGGNVAENSGGAHCLKHGFTVHHVTGLRDRHGGRGADRARDGTGARPATTWSGCSSGPRARSGS